MSEQDYEYIEITEEQQAAIDKQNAAAEEEATWPLYQVELQGDTVEWEFRDAPEYYTEDGSRRDGVEAPKVEKTAYCRVDLHAKNEDMARARAMNANPEYHTVLNIEQVENL